MVKKIEMIRNQFREKIIKEFISFSRYPLVQNCTILIPLLHTACNQTSQLTTHLTSINQIFLYLLILLLHNNDSKTRIGSSDWGKDTNAGGII